MSAIDELADATHSKAIADLITSGKRRPELLMTLGKVAAPRYANFIGRYNDHPTDAVRPAAAVALGSADSEGVAPPVLVQLLARGWGPEAFPVRGAAGQSLVPVAKQKGAEGTRRRLL